MKSYRWKKVDTLKRLTGRTITDIAKIVDYQPNTLFQVLSTRKDCSLEKAELITEQINPNAKVEDYFDVLDKYLPKEE